MGLICQLITDSILQNIAAILEPRLYPERFASFPRSTPNLIGQFSVVEGKKLAASQSSYLQRKENHNRQS